MAATKTPKAKSPFSDLLERVEQLTSRIRDEREKQMARLEEQLDKARDTLNKQLENLNLDRIRDLQDNYREKAIAARYETTSQSSTRRQHPRRTLVPTGSVAHIGRSR